MPTYPSPSIYSNPVPGPGLPPPVITPPTHRWQPVDMTTLPPDVAAGAWNWYAKLSPTGVTGGSQPVRIDNQWWAFQWNATTDSMTVLCWQPIIQHY